MSPAYISTTLRSLVRKRAQGRCEYCLLPEGVAFFRHEPDHILALNHGGKTTDDNLALSCFDCNRFKGSDIASMDPLSGAVVALFNPRTQDWHEHYASDNGRILPLTPTGRATERLLKLNLSERVQVRWALAERRQWG
ncbi:MAG TPA: HNH endonuclease signature motif containing protein [Blastocatellia bacterium]|nr:HNH endonuclease signature motif containing protein [Blastocatellia bacterium]